MVRNDLDQTGQVTEYIRPKKTKRYEYLVAQSARLVFNEKPLESYIRVSIRAFFAIAKSDSKKKKQAKLANQLRPAMTPDADNIAKAVLDGLNGVVYADDKQIVELKVIKAYAEVPRVEVTIEEI